MRTRRFWDGIGFGVRIALLFFFTAADAFADVPMQHWNAQQPAAAPVSSAASPQSPPPQAKSEAPPPVQPGAQSDPRSEARAAKPDPSRAAPAGLTWSGPSSSVGARDELSNAASPPKHQEGAHALHGHFAAGAAAIAHRRPDIIKQAITYNRDGSASVHLFQRSGYDGAGRPILKPVTVQIDRQTAMRGSTLGYGSSHAHPQEQWSTLLERGFAQVKPGSGSVDGGSPADAFEMLTGRPSDRVNVDPRGADGLYAMMKQAGVAGRPMAAFTGDDRWRGATQRLEQARPSSPDVATIKRLNGEASHGAAGVVVVRTYAILGVSERTGQKMIVLRSPSGELDGANVAGDGIFQLSIDTFAALFQQLDIAGVTSMEAQSSVRPAAALAPAPAPKSTQTFAPKPAAAAKLAPTSRVAPAAAPAPMPTIRPAMTPSQSPPPAAPLR